MNRLIKFLNRGHSRTILAKKNILFSIFINVFGIFVVFTTISISIKYLEKENIIISNNLSTLMTLRTVVAFFSNATGKIKIQLYASIFLAIINIPLSYYFTKTLQFGTSGVFMATIICMLFIYFFVLLQCKRIIQDKAIGICNA